MKEHRSQAQARESKRELGAYVSDPPLLAVAMPTLAYEPVLFPGVAVDEYLP